MRTTHIPIPAAMRHRRSHSHPRNDSTRTQTDQHTARLTIASQLWSSALDHLDARYPTHPLAPHLPSHATTTLPAPPSAAVAVDNEVIRSSMTSRRGESRSRPSVGHPRPGSIAKDADRRSDRLGIESLGGRSKVTRRVGSTPWGLQLSPSP